MKNLLSIISSDEGQDIAEYAVMLAVILVLVVGTIRLVDQTRTTCSRKLEAVSTNKRAMPSFTAPHSFGSRCCNIAISPTTPLGAASTSSW